MFRFSYRHSRHLILWIIPLLYAVLGIILGFFIPQIDQFVTPYIPFYLSATVAIEILSAITQGMLALTAIVFSVLFVLVQYSSAAFSPRLVGMFISDRVVLHTLGVFIGTFVYSLQALTRIDTSLSFNQVPIATVLMAFLFLGVSIIMFVMLLERMTILQISNMLALIGSRGRAAILDMYNSNKRLRHTHHPIDTSQLPVTQSLIYQGYPQAIIEVNFSALLHLARQAGGIIKLNYAIGDYVQDGAPLLEVRGSANKIFPFLLSRTITLGSERTINQDPQFALRILVDIAIKALSPALNDPTTAVQAINQIEGLLRILGNVELDLGMLTDEDGEVRVIYPTAKWEDFVSLAINEIRLYGAGTLQVVRRLAAMLDDLEEAVPRERRPAIHNQFERLIKAVRERFLDEDDLQDALQVDRQGLGLGRDGDIFLPREPTEI
jgi:uncharacterized membrane protein